MPSTIRRSQRIDVDYYSLSPHVILFAVFVHYLICHMTPNQIVQTCTAKNISHEHLIEMLID